MTTMTETRTTVLARVPLDAWKGVILAVGREADRPMLEHVAVWADWDGATIAATDSHRLHWWGRAERMDRQPELIIHRSQLPARVAAGTDVTIVRLGDDARDLALVEGGKPGDHVIEWRGTDKKMHHHIVRPHQTMTGLSGRSTVWVCEPSSYPSLATLIPSEFGGSATFGMPHDTRQDGLRMACRIANAVEGKRGHQRPVELRPSEKVALIRPMMGDLLADPITVRLDVETTGEVPEAVGYAPQYILDALAAVGGRRVTFNFAPGMPELKPVSIEGGSSVRVLLMPVRL